MDQDFARFLCAREHAHTRAHTPPPGPSWWPGSGPEHHPVQSAPLHPLPALLGGLRVTPLGLSSLHRTGTRSCLLRDLKQQSRKGHWGVGSRRPCIVGAWGGGGGGSTGSERPLGSEHLAWLPGGAGAPQGDRHVCSQGQDEEDRLPVHALQLGPLRVEARLQPAPLAGRVWHHPGGKAGQSHGRACWAARLATHPPVSPSFCWQN